jgi:hypothetical protein
VHFGYKNQQRVDYIFVVDNSPSMDKASLNADQDKLNRGLRTKHHISKDI